MILSLLDISIIVVYLLVVLFLGFYISKKASQDLKSYFLGGSNIKWYFLGLSNGSGMFDVSGTAWTVAILYVYGLKSAWIPWLWPVWNQVFIMVFLAIWMRRSNVMTGAEWITMRFGHQTGGKAAHIIVVIFAVVSVIGFIAYFFEGIGKFATTILPWDLGFHAGFIHLSSAQSYAVIMMGLTAIYTIKGGMYSVVGTEVLQFIVLSIASFLIAAFAMRHTTVAQINAQVPRGWHELFFGWHLNLDWKGVFDAVNTKIRQDGFELFGCLVMMMVFKGIFASLAGPVPGFDMQRVLSCKTPREAAKMSGFTLLVLYIPRYLMVAGLTVLGLVYVTPMLKSQPQPDFEIILPQVVRQIIPAGLKGIILAGLLSAFMSTFSAFVNAAPAYLVNDLYKKYFRPAASPKHYVKWSYLASIGIVLIGILFGFYTESLNSVTLWITSSLYGGYTAANVLKWIWWRFNGYGYFWGMLVGLASATIVPQLFPSTPAIYVFPVILALSFTGCFAGCLLTPPVEEVVLISFYKNVRPWGWWKPIHDKVVAQDPAFEGNKDFKRDMVNILIGIAWQMSMVVMPIYFVIRDFTIFGICAGVFVATSLLLKFNWYDKLEKDDSP